MSETNEEKEKLEKKIVELEVKIEQLEKENEELRRDIKVVASSVLDHIKGKLTIQDLQICYQKIAEVKKYLSVVPNTPTNSSIEAILADKLGNAILSEKMGGSSRQPINFEEVDEDDLERLRNKGKNKDNSR